MEEKKRKEEYTDGSCESFGRVNPFFVMSREFAKSSYGNIRVRETDENRCLVERGFAVRGGPAYRLKYIKTICELNVNLIITHCTSEGGNESVNVTIYYCNCLFFVSDFFFCCLHRISYHICKFQAFRNDNMKYE